MNEPLQVFEPLKPAILATSGIAVIIAGLALFTLFYLLRIQWIDQQYRRLFAMLCFFTLIIAVGIAVFGWFTGERIGNVCLFEDRIDSPYGVIEFNEVKDIVMYKEPKRSPLTPQFEQEYNNRLLIMLKSGKNYVFSESNYPVDTMLTVFWDQWKKSEKLQ